MPTVFCDLTRGIKGKTGDIYKRMIDVLVLMDTLDTFPYG